MSEQVELSHAALGRALGISERETGKYRRQGMPGTIEGAKAWRAENVKPRPGARSGDDQSLTAQKLAAEIANLKQQETFRRLKNQAARGKLVDRTEALRAVGELCARIKTRLECLPDEFEMRFPAETRAENKADFAEAIRLLLKEMATWEVL